MKNDFITLGLAFVFIINGLFGCIEEETGDIKIQGKGYFPSIQEALDAASNHDKIMVYQGVYNETITINKSIQLIAVNKNSTIIQYMGNEPGIAVIQITTDNCSVDGFLIKTMNVLYNSHGIKITSNNVKITNNTIHEFFNGISLENANKNRVLHNKITNNENGLYTVHSNNNKIKSNNITKNEVYGVYLSSRSDYNLVQYNKISRNGWGLRIKGSNNNVFENNTVIRNVNDSFIFCCGAKNNVVLNNTVIDDNLN